MKIKEEVRTELQEAREDLDRLEDETEYFARGLVLHDRLTKLLNQLRDKLEEEARNETLS
jgi:hypothetical protein